jgi:hypothetical protein
MRRNVARILTLGFALGCLSSPGDAAEKKTGDLAAAAQNPIASMMTLPFQNNTYFGIDPDNRTANSLLIQPVYPISLSKDWIVITRAIVPLIYIEGFHSTDPEVPNAQINADSAFGLGDINFTAYFSPKQLLGLGGGEFTWGVGPSITLDSSTDDDIGSEKWSAGPGLVGVFIKHPWVAGALFRQLWSFAGNDNREDVSQFLMQPFINYNLSKGWYLVSSPIITANWKKDSSNTWSIPVGGGFGRIFKIGNQPVNAQVQSFYNMVKPDGGADWSLRFQFTFLFPK